MRVLFVSAHPDDIEFRMSGTAAKYRAKEMMSTTRLLPTVKEAVLRRESTVWNSQKFVGKKRKPQPHL